uniref:ATP-binding cassette domain-containing protein n=1 Tax=Bradyrhizobium sp. 33ap4 TaxID=3061630 RepID=UPI00293136D0
MRHLVNRRRLVQVCNLEQLQSVTKEYHGPVVGAAAVAGEAPGPGRGSMPGANNAFVKFSEVQKTYDGETLVVKNLNLDIARGEFLTMLGPSGSGKTTTLMMLAGFEMPTHGRILLEGRSIDNMPPHKRDIGMVFQNY